MKKGVLVSWWPRCRHEECVDGGDGSAAVIVSGIGTEHVHLSHKCLSIN